MKVLLVGGKGGVGKTAVTAGLAHFYADRGGALAISLNSSDSLSNHLTGTSLDKTPKQLDKGLFAAEFSKQEILDSFIGRQFRFGPVKKWVLSHPLYPHMTAITPGLREVLILDRIYSFATTEYMDRWNTILVDMPATGHGINLLNVIDLAARTIKFGPLRRTLMNCRNKLRDPTFTRVVVVTLPEETPVRESRELVVSMQEKIGVAIDSLIVNKIDYLPMSPESTEALEQLSDSQLLGILEHSESLDFIPGTASVRQACELQRSRAEVAMIIMRELNQWWQEPITMIQHFSESDSGQLSKSIASELINGGFRG